MNESAAIYEQEHPRVFAYCLRRVGNWHVAEDVTSAVFVEALPLLPHPNPHAFLLTLARFRVHDYWRQSRKRATLVFSDAFVLGLDQYVELADTHDPIERLIDACDTAMAAAMLRATLKECSAQDLRLIDLRFVQQLPATVVARELGITKQDLNKRQNALYYRLAQRLAPAPPKPHPTCLICEGTIYGRGLCDYHYQQAREGKRIPMLPPKVQYTPTACQECGAKHYARGYCKRHYEEVRVRERMENRRLAEQLL